MGRNEGVKKEMNGVVGRKRGRWKSRNEGEG